MNEQGLAQQAMVGAQPSMEEVLQEVIRMLEQGSTPEQLLEMGVPQELLQQALMLMQQEQKQMVVSDGGLATSVPR